MTQWIGLGLGLLLLSSIAVAQEYRDYTVPLSKRYEKAIEAEAQRKNIPPEQLLQEYAVTALERQTTAMLEARLQRVRDVLRGADEATWRSVEALLKIKE